MTAWKYAPVGQAGERPLYNCNSMETSKLLDMCVCVLNPNAVEEGGSLPCALTLPILDDS